MRRMEKQKSTLMFITITVLLIAISVFCITGTVRSQSRAEGHEMEKYYHLQEMDMLAQTREKLEALGYSDSGVNLTRVVDEAGGREYTFAIHHRKIGTLAEEELEELERVLICDAGFTESCTVKVTFF